MKLIFLFVLASCSALTPSGSPKEGKTAYSFTDVTGSYRFIREHKLIKQKLVTRTQLVSTSGSQKILEKSVVVSNVGTIKAKDKRLLTVRPEGSEFVVWLEGQKYSSWMRLNPKNKSMTVKLESPEGRWSGSQEIKFPKGKYFCFYSQMSECLYHNRFLERTKDDPELKPNFYIIWDSWPYLQEQLTNVGRSLFAPASVKFDGKVKNQFRFMVEADGQIILYHFSKSFDLVKIAWIAQGITVVPPGEETLIEDEE